MSVINTMLKDLEKRENNFSENNAILQGLGSRSPQPPATSKKLHLTSILISFGFVLILLAIIYFVSPYQLVNTSAQPVVTGNTQEPTQTVALTSPANEPVPQAETQQQQNLASVISTPAVTPIPSENSLPKIAAKKEEVSSVEPQTQKAIHKSVSQKPKELAAPEKQKSSTTKTVTSNDDIEANINSSVSKTQRTLTQEEKSQQAYATAMTLYNQGQQQAAKSSLKEALSYYPANTQARQLLAAIHIFEQRPDIAATVIEQGLAINANDMDLLRVYLQALVQLADYPKAIGVMEKHFQLTTPEDAAYLAGLYQKNNQHMLAIKYFSQALRLIPNNSIWWMGQGISLEEMGQKQQALDSYQQAITTGRLSSQLREFVLLRIVAIKSRTGPTS